MRWIRSAVVAMTLLSARCAVAGDGNRLTYIDSNDPYYVSCTFPKLITPQWVDEEGVDAAIILAIDDMRGHEKWEAFLRPLIDRLKQIDGRAPLSIMTCQIDPKDPHLQTWLKEGLRLETHTYDHPCPLMADGNFERAKNTYDRCVDQMFAVPNNLPVAFRMPCCDSLDTCSPRFFAEIFNKKTAAGHFLSIDTSVFQVFTPNDPVLPRNLVFDAGGRRKFRKYLPFKSFVNTIDDYPYPYVIDKLCWEFPCVVPSDWEGFNLNKAFSPTTLADMKSAIDATVIKQGVFDLVFHPHGWIKPQQLVELVDYASTRYGKRVKFMSFREAQERLNKNLLANQPLRAADGADNGVRLLDLNGDGYVDVVIGNDQLRQTHIWSPVTKSWLTSSFPMALVTPDHRDAGARFGIVHADGRPSIICRTEKAKAAWHFDGTNWVADGQLINGLDILTTVGGHDNGVRLRDLNGDGRCELLVSNDKQNAIFAWSEGDQKWSKLPFTLPAGATIVDAEGRPAGLRFADIDADGLDDVLFSNDDHYSVHLFASMKEGWTRQLLSGKRGEKPISEELPKFVRNGTDNGAWVHSRGFWWRNESTSAMPDLVDRRSFNQLLGQTESLPKSPAASLQNIRVAPGFTIEQVATEPLIEDPVAFAWGADGKLWVVEMCDYPLGLDGHGKPGGKVKFLESTHNDGKYDKATLFLDNLPFPTGIMPWRKGVLVSCAPEIFYAEDTTGDGKANVRVPLYTGFGEGNQQHRVNTFAWGLDNWIYCANGHCNGKIKSLKTGQIVDISGRDFRIKPDEGLIETATGITQYGRCRDDLGNWFGNDNSNPMFHFVLDDHYLRRNPSFAPPAPRLPVSVIPAAAPVFPISRTLARFNDPGAANHFTSANSAIVYRDDLFGPAFNSSTFVSEPVHNLIHREVITPKGITFTSQRGPDDQMSEFIASTDEWFRPTMLQTGPDGALWFADMYRAVIEHPEWIPKDWQARLDLRAGSDKGRIYRVFPVDRTPREFQRLDTLDTGGLVAALDSPSGWRRDTAQRLLVERHDSSAIPLLAHQVIDCANPLCRLHALCTLDGLGGVDEKLLSRSLADPHPGVRRHAVRISESIFSSSPALLDQVCRMVDDDDPQVQLQLSYSLGAADAPRAGKALGQLAAGHATDVYITAAVLSSINKSNFESLAGEWLTSQATAPSPAALQGLTRSAEALGGPAMTSRLISQITGAGGDEPWRFSAVATMLDALDSSRSSTTQPTDLSLNHLFDSARRIAADSALPPENRVAALQLLGRDAAHEQEDLTQLAALLSPKTTPQLQIAAATALGRRRDRGSAALLLTGWKTYSPALRAQVIDALLSRPSGVTALLDAVEKRTVAPVEIDPARRQRLVQARDPAVRDRAMKLLSQTTNPDRAKVVDSYREAVLLSGDAGHGKELFAKTCAVCHRLGDVGFAVGPDLASIGNKSPDSLLVSILDPNAAVESRYANYLVETSSGDSYSGVLGDEAGNAITLVLPGGQSKSFLRSELKTFRSTGLSLMPEGLEAGLKPQDIADLIAVIRGAGPARTPKQFEGNTPAVVKPNADGTLALTSKNCHIYGKTLVLEAKYDNLGYWMSEDDQAEWTTDIAGPGKYGVWLNYACEEASAGNTFVLQCGATELQGIVAGTQSWDRYRRAKVGEINLPAGKQQIVLRCGGAPTNALMDLKDVLLVPIRGQ